MRTNNTSNIDNIQCHDIEYCIHLSQKNKTSNEEAQLYKLAIDYSQSMHSCVSVIIIISSTDTSCVNQVCIEIPNVVIGVWIRRK